MGCYGNLYGYCGPQEMHCEFVWWSNNHQDLSSASLGMGWTPKQLDSFKRSIAGLAICWVFVGLFMLIPLMQNPPDFLLVEAAAAEVYSQGILTLLKLSRGDLVGGLCPWRISMIFQVIYSNICRIISCRLGMCVSQDWPIINHCQGLLNMFQVLWYASYRSWQVPFKFMSPRRCQILTMLLWMSRCMPTDHVTTQHVTTCYNMLQHVTTCYNMLQPWLHINTEVRRSPLRHGDLCYSTWRTREPKGRRGEHCIGHNIMIYSNNRTTNNRTSKNRTSNNNSVSNNRISEIIIVIIVI